MIDYFLGRIGSSESGIIAKQRERDDLQAAVDDFLARGGKIKLIPVDAPPTKTHKRRTHLLLGKKANGR